MKERLDKIIANACMISRTDAQKAIRRGRACVNGEPCRLPEQKADWQSDGITLDGEQIMRERFLYIMLHKPAGYLSATEDKREPTVMELLPEQYLKRELAIVGRLDKDTEGLLLITDNGELNHKLTSPKKNVLKLYFAVLDQPVSERDIEVFADGMELGNFVSKPSLLEVCGEDKRECYVTISEGKFHQIKRMFEKCEKKVEYLKRLKIGTLELDKTLKKGDFRHLTQLERDSLLLDL